MSKKFGGVKITFQRVSSSVCAGCGLSFEACWENWNKKLGITGHASDTQHSEYKGNVQRIRNAVHDGLDPFCSQANFLYRSNWTPHMPPGSFDPVAHPYRYITGKTTGKHTGGDIAKAKGHPRTRGNGSSGRNRSGSTGSGRRGRR